ncbi:alpha/beta hydrolase [Cohnella sp. REN36]|uniref:alpha/beta hydrolase n=1 Tax=Cohnella sp. REN36 TaxID=2887347 RepID=UPI003562CFA3|nr:esterase family protein [Cohnella sp. REN36]
MTPDQPVRRTVVKHQIPSARLASGERSVRLYLPPDYRDDVAYPVVYCQDGEDFFNFGRVATIAHERIAGGVWEPFVIVGVDVDKKVRTEEYQPGSERHEAYLSFWMEELVPYVESRYSVRRDPTGRLLAGDSLGGAVSLSIALRHPEAFTRILSLSGAYYDASIRQIQQAADLSHLALWMIVGLQETAYQTDHGTFNFVELNRMARRLLERKGAYIDYREKNGEHKWGFWQTELPEALGAFLGPEAHM